MLVNTKRMIEPQQSEDNNIEHIQSVRILIGPGSIFYNGQETEVVRCTY